MCFYSTLIAITHLCRQRAVSGMTVRPLSLRWKWGKVRIGSRGRSLTWRSRSRLAMIRRRGLSGWRSGARARTGRVRGWVWRRRGRRSRRSARSTGAPRWTCLCIDRALSNASPELRTVQLYTSIFRWFSVSMWQVFLTTEQF